MFSKALTIFLKPPSTFNEIKIDLIGVIIRNPID